MPGGRRARRGRIAGVFVVCVAVCVLATRATAGLLSSSLWADQHARVSAPAETAAGAPLPELPTRAVTEDVPGVRVAGIQVDRADTPSNPENGSSPAPEAASPPPALPPPPAPAPPAPAPPGPTAGCPGSTEGPFVAAHNAARCDAGMGPLELDPAASAHAQFHAERLLADGACAGLWHSAELPQWYPAGYWGENAACVQWGGGCWGDLGLVMRGWLASAEHAPNIFNPNFRSLGVGIACDGHRTYFVVQFHS